MNATAPQTDTLTDLPPSSGVEVGSDIDAYFARLAEDEAPSNAATEDVAVEETFGSWREFD